MIAAAALVLAAATSVPPPNFNERASALETRVTADQSRKLLAPGQDALLHVQIQAARRAYAAHDPAAAAMLDVIDRQLAELDHTLSRAEDGRGVTVHVGDTVLVAMQDGLSWIVTNSDSTVLPLKSGVMWARGVQGGFTAKQPGTAILSLTLREPAPSGVKQPVVFTVTVLPR